MTYFELKDKRYWSNVPERWYSINEGLKPDACILYKNYSIWDFFYLDEMGERHENRVFSTDEEAYEFLWSKMEKQLNVFNIQPKKR